MAGESTPEPAINEPATKAAPPETTEKLTKEREGKINELDTRADQLREKATQFNTTAIKVNRKMWWENTKMKIIIGVSVGVLLLTILMIVLWQLGVFSSSSNA